MKLHCLPSVIASAAKQSMSPQGSMDCFVALLLAMTTASTIFPCPTTMLRLSSNYESWPRYRHGRLVGRRPRAFQYADRADDRPRADRERAGARGRHHAADRKFASAAAGGRRPDRTRETAPPPP